MRKYIRIGVDIAKNSFQVHALVSEDCSATKRKLSRSGIVKYLADVEPCAIGMEACGSAHYWARQFRAMGHEVKLTPPIYVKAYVKRGKNDAADAEAICEAAQRPTMRFVVPKSAEAQAAAVVFRTRDLLVRQRTQLINALRGHLAEFGFVVPQGAGHVNKLITLVEDPASDMPIAARTILSVLSQTFQTIQLKITVLDREIAARAKADATIRRLMTIPGVGPVVATAIVALAPAASTFRRGRDFAAWLGLTPRQHSSGGKERLGRVTRMGERSLRRLLILGASSVTKVAARHPTRGGVWLAGMLFRKPRMLVTVALANKIARTVWALMAHGGSYRAPAVAV